LSAKCIREELQRLKQIEKAEFSLVTVETELEVLTKTFGKAGLGFINNQSSRER
jgi:hypothetical protein